MVGSGAARRMAGVGLCLALGSGLAGCGGTRGFEAEGQGGGSTLGNLVAFNSFTAPPAVATTKAPEKLECPTVEVLDGTSSLRTYGPGEQSSNTVKYQYSLGDVVRECSHVGNQLVMKVGIEGRVLLGPAGAAGAFTAPVRVAVRREKDQSAAATAFYRIPVSMPTGQTQAAFSLVSDPIAVPFTQEHAADDYTIVVGFDEKGTGGPVAARKTRTHKRG